jgi:hypothetical protein
MDEDIYDDFTKLPAQTDDEDILLSAGPIRWSLRQILMMLSGFVAWFIACAITTAILPINSLFAYVLWSWILVVSAVLALVKRDGRPLEEWITRWLTWKTSPQKYILKDPNARVKPHTPQRWSDDEDDDEDFHAPSF